MRFDSCGDLIPYEYKGERVCIASDFGDEVAVHPQGLDNEEAYIVPRAELVLWSSYSFEKAMAEMD